MTSIVTIAQNMQDSEDVGDHEVVGGRVCSPTEEDLVEGEMDDGMPEPQPKPEMFLSDDVIDSIHADGGPPRAFYECLNHLMKDRKEEFLQSVRDNIEVFRAIGGSWLAHLVLWLPGDTILEGKNARKLLFVLQNMEELGLPEVDWDAKCFNEMTMMDYAREVGGPIMADVLIEHGRCSFTDSTYALVNIVDEHVNYVRSQGAPEYYDIDHVIQEDDPDVERLARDKAAYYAKKIFRWALPKMSESQRDEIRYYVVQGWLPGWEAEIEAAFA